MFDLTKEIKLSPELQKKYAFARIFLHVFFVFSAGFVAYRILFPIVPLDFSLSTPDSLKNALVAPRMQQSGQFPEKRTATANNRIFFNANPLGQFSKVSVSFTLDKGQPSIENAPIEIHKSYQAFFYPTGQPIGFKDGALLATAGGDYYMISDGALRRFSNTDTILKLGYPKNSFTTVSKEDLQYNEVGDEISDPTAYPDSTIFLVDETYYQLKNQELSPFVSTGAFLSQFEPVSAIAKDRNFLSRYTLAETFSGFSDGTLVSSADSVFVISDGKSYPFESPETFLAMGFDFDEVLQITQDELNAQEKQKQFTRNDPHPNGTVFLDRNSNEYFIVKNGSKRPLPTEAITNTYTSKQKPIVADSQTAELKSSCILEEKFFSSDKYECSASLQNLESAIGNDYQISAEFVSDTKIKSINATFSTPLSWTSMRTSISKIKSRITTRQN